MSYPWRPQGAPSYQTPQQQPNALYRSNMAINTYGRQQPPATTNKFRAKVQTEQRAEIDLMVRLFHKQVSRRMQDKMHKDFMQGTGKFLFSSQVSINNPLRGQTIKGSLNQET